MPGLRGEGGGVMIAMRHLTEIPVTPTDSCMSQDPQKIFISILSSSKRSSDGPNGDAFYG